MDRADQPKIVAIYQETYRQSLHIAVALFIIPLHWFGFWYAVVFALTALVWNIWAMPRWFPGTLRPAEKAKGYSRGMIVYPVCIMILFIFFPLPIAAAGWAVLSVSDGAATLAGKILGGRALPWNKNKTWAGSFAFFISATVFGWLALEWTGKHGSACPIRFPHAICHWDNIDFLVIGWPFFLIQSSIAAMFAATAESLPQKKIDDNILPPIVYALFFALLIPLFSLLLFPLF